jgi:hypothetical protein
MLGERRNCILRTGLQSGNRNLGTGATIWGRSAWSSYLSHHSLAFWKSFSHGDVSMFPHSLGQ